MIRKPRLFTPGPTPLHPAVLEAMARPIPHHRTDEFRAIFKECTVGLKSFLQTEDDVLVLACSGTGGMEAALVNVLSPGDRMLALVAGNFGERWANIGKAYGMDVVTLKAPLGDAVAPEEVAKALDADPSIKGVFVQLNESSTGARHDVEALAKITRGRPGTLLVVDAISGAGAMPLATSAWGVDVVIVGSQKSLALPPGLAFVSVSARAWERIESAKAPRFYFDLRRERKNQVTGESAFTPAISNMIALRAALEFVHGQGGVESLIKNAANLAACTRAAAAALGLPLVAPRAHGDALTACYAPAGVDSGAIVKGLRAEFASTVAGGQGDLKGKIFRIAHLGYYDATDILGLLATLEITLHRLGHKFALGAGMAAAEKTYVERVQMPAGGGGGGKA
jgi:aspartate aminotransferase-like enzyme